MNVAKYTKNILHSFTEEEELKEAIIKFNLAIKTDFPIPNHYTEFNINTLKNKKNELIENLRAQKISDEEITNGRKAVAILTELIYILPKHALLQKEFIGINIQKIKKKIQKEVDESTLKNQKIGNEIEKINRKYSKIRQIQTQIEMYLLRPKNEQQDGKKKDLITEIFNKTK
ncbi:MAG: hypothetical protein ACTSRG_24465 [Candidatus Helarchaeota archaeon]